MTFQRAAAYCVAVSMIATTAHAAHIHPERHYQEQFCAEIGGQLEYVLPDRTRVDCLTDEYAIEVDFAAKWAESIGQALYYADQTGRKPGVLLVLEKNSDHRHLRRLQTLASIYKITIWTVSI